MSGAIAQTTQRWPGQARRRRIAVCLTGGALLAALSVAGHGLAQRPAQGHTAPAVRVDQPATYPYRRVPALLARSQAHDPLLRLPHARWFIRVRHGHAQVVVVDHAPPQTSGATVVGTGRGQ